MNFTIDYYTYEVRTPDVRARRPLVPVQTETTTDNAFRRPVIPPLWRRPPSVYKGTASPAETLSVHRASYRPFRADQVATAKPTCIGCATGNAAKPRRVVKVPVESHTTYATHYGGGTQHERPGRELSGPESCPHQQSSTMASAIVAVDAAPKAHDYGLTYRWQRVLRERHRYAIYDMGFKIYTMQRFYANCKWNERAGDRLGNHWCVRERLSLAPIDGFNIILIKNELGRTYK